MKNNNERGKINMKKMIAFLLAAVMLLSLTACGGGDKPANSEPGTSTGETTDNSTEKDSAPHEAFCQVLFGVIDAQSRRKRESAKRKGSALCVFSLRVRAAASS